jgi:hypothetical protein
MKSKFRVVEGGKPASIFDNLEALRILPDEGREEATQRVYNRRREFRRLDETWANLLLTDPDTPPWARLAIVLLAEADFHQHIKVTAKIATAAHLTRNQKRRALKHLERQGFISVEWRGRGRALIATPLQLSGRPRRR